MCLIKRKKSTYDIKVESLVDYTNRVFLEKETPLVFDFSKPKTSFSFCGNPYSYYDTGYFDFKCAVDQTNRALTLLKESLISISNKFESEGLNKAIVKTKISNLLKMEAKIQDEMREELVRHQAKGNNAILLTSITLFQEISRKYLIFVLECKDTLLNYVKNNYIDFSIVNSLSKAIKEQGILLPEELRDYKNNLTAYSIIYNLENFIRTLIICILKGQSNNQILQKEQIEYIIEQKKKEINNKWCDERYGGDLFYLNYSDLIKIIKYRNNDFEKEGILIEKIENELDKIGIIRNKVAHNTLVTNDDIDTLKIYSKNIYKYLNEYKERIYTYKFNTKKTIN